MAGLDLGMGTSTRDNLVLVHVRMCFWLQQFNSGGVTCTLSTSGDSQQRASHQHALCDENSDNISLLMRKIVTGDMLPLNMWKEKASES